MTPPDPFDGVPDHLKTRMDEFEKRADALRQASEFLMGQVRVLVEQGWSEAQARDLVVAFELQVAKSR